MAGHTPDRPERAFVVVKVGVEILETLPVEECPTCGHMSVGVATAMLTMNGAAQSVGTYRAPCAEGCDDEPVISTELDDD